MEFDNHFIGDNTGVFPLTIADAKYQALDRHTTLKHLYATFLLDAEWKLQVRRFSFER